MFNNTHKPQDYYKPLLWPIVDSNYMDWEDKLREKVVWPPSHLMTFIHIHMIITFGKLQCNYILHVPVYVHTHVPSIASPCKVKFRIYILMNSCDGCHDNK